MNPTVVEYIRLGSQFSVILPLVVYLIHIKRAPIQNHIIGSVVVLSGVADLISLYTGSAILFNIFEVFQFVLLTWFFNELLYKKRQKAIGSIAIGLYVTLVLLSVWRWGLHVNYTLVWAAGSMIILVHNFVYVFSLPRMLVERYFDKHLLTSMIFIASLFIYFLVTLIVFVLFDPVANLQNKNALKEFWTIHNAFNIVKNIGFAFGFYYTGKRYVYMTFQQVQRLAEKQAEEIRQN